MALTITERAALYSILDVPYPGPTYVRVMENSMRAALYIDGKLPIVAASDIDNYLVTVIEATAELEQEVRNLLQIWTPIRFVVANVKPVGGDANGGIEFSIDKKKDEIKRQITILVPFYRRHEFLLQRMGGTQTAASIGVAC